MGMASGKRSTAGLVGWGVGAAIALCPVLAFAGAVDLYYERTVMAVADARCRLFTPQMAAALASAQAQSRGAALRAGVPADDLAKVERRARAKAMAEPCDSPALKTASARVRDAFAGFSKLQKMNYPGDHHDWMAERMASRSGRVWSLSQSVPFGSDALTFGLAGQNGGLELMAVVRFADKAQPYAARLVIRDVARTRGPYLDRRKADAKGVLPLAGRVTPRSATRAFMADAKLPVDPLLNPAKAKDMIAYRFPVAAAKALADLDPREAVEIEFLFAAKNGDIVRRAYVEVGDFAAGRAFLAAAQR